MGNRSWVFAAQAWREAPEPAGGFSPTNTLSGEAVSFYSPRRQKAHLARGFLAPGSLPLPCASGDPPDCRVGLGRGPQFPALPPNTTKLAFLRQFPVAV